MIAKKSRNANADPMDGIFTSPEQKKVLQKRTQGMSINYPDVEDGSKATVTCYPSGFNFDSRIKKFNTVVIKKLEEIRKNLELETPKNLKDADSVAQNLQNKNPQGKYYGTDIKKEIGQCTGPVSYTHLTLPTICSV